jgi:hypothetical protein
MNNKPFASECHVDTSYGHILLVKATLPLRAHLPVKPVHRERQQSLICFCDPAITARSDLSWCSARVPSITARTTSENNIILYVLNCEHG